MTYGTFLSTVAVVLSSASLKRSLPDMSVDKFIRNPLWATLVGALVAAMVVSVVVFVHSGEAAPQAADEQTPYASVSPKSPLIVGGTAVPNGKYPFMAALLDTRRAGDAFDELFCGGTLIDKDSVLTAAHCLVNPKPDKLQVVVGRTALNQNRGQLRSVSRRFIHPRYNGNGYDAAVLKLSRPVKSIKPIKLATAKQNNLEKPAHILTAAGWGVVKQRPALSTSCRSACTKCRSPWFLTLAPNRPISLRAQSTCRASMSLPARKGTAPASATVVDLCSTLAAAHRLGSQATAPCRNAGRHATP